MEVKKLNSYRVDGAVIDSVDLKCLLVSRGVTVAKAVYRAFAGKRRLDINPLACNCLLLSDGTVCQLTDVGFHLRYLAGMLSWSDLKLLRYASALGTPFSLRMDGGLPALFYNNNFLDHISFPDPTDFYQRRTVSGMPFVGNAVIQGIDWVAFQCLWPCDHAAAGKPCGFCFSGAEHESLARRKKPLPSPVRARDFAEVVTYALERTRANALQITGGSTFDGIGESRHIPEYLEALGERGLTRRLNEILLYITPPKDLSLIDKYFSLGASRVACSLEVWDEELAAGITPGKISFATREAYVTALRYTAEKYGPAKAFTNFIIGLESFETLAEGAAAMAERGILPAAAVWMPMGRPVRGSMTAPGVAYYQRVKELFAELYVKYGLYPPESHGLNVCVESDITRYARQG